MEVQILAARTLSLQLADTVVQQRYEGAVWYRKFRLIAEVLAEIDRSAAERLQEAAEILLRMYSGDRNFADFYIHRDDPQERVAENDRLAAMVDELRTLLSPE